MYGAHSQVPSFMPGTGMFALLLPASHGEAPGRPRGGSIALIDALVAALEAAGGTLALDARVVGIDDESGVRRVRLADGRTVDTDRVVSSIDVRRTSRLLAPAVPELEAAASRAHDGSLNVGEIKIDVALTDRPSFGPLDAAPDAIWMVQEKTDSLRRAYGDIVAGRIPTSPAFMWASPSESDADRGAAGRSGGVDLGVHAAHTGRRALDSGARAARQPMLILDGFAAITGTDLRRPLRRRRRHRADRMGTPARIGHRQPQSPRPHHRPAARMETTRHGRHTAPRRAGCTCPVRAPIPAGVCPASRVATRPGPSLPT